MNHLKQKMLPLIIFLLSSISLVVSLTNFYNLGIAADEFGTSPDIILGSELMLALTWLQFVFLLVIVICSLILLFKKRSH